jgi:hypothetical protein
MMNACVAATSGTDGVTLGYRKCAAPEPVTIFELSIRKNGEVLYNGSAAARTQGEQSTRIESRVADRLREAIRLAVRESRTHHEPRPGVAEDRATLCLTVREAGSQSELNSGRERTRKLIDLINEMVDPRRWACPTAQPIGPASLNDGYCGKARINATVNDETSCNVSNSVEIYEDGTVHHWVTEGDPKRATERSLHHFATLAAGDFKTLLAQTRRCVETMTVEDFLDRAPAPAVPVPPARLCGRPEDIHAFKDLLSRLVHMEWADGRGRAANCPVDTVVPAGLLILTSPFADGSWSKKYQR